MNKKIIFRFLIAIVLICGLFMLTGCGKKDEETTSSKTENSTSKKAEENKEKVAFTKEVSKTRVKYKVPEAMDSIGSFKDLGVTCNIYYYTNQSSVMALYPYDDNVDNIDKVTINGVEYETYKYVENTMIHYVYRTKVGNFYHLFTYDVYGKEYDDSQVEAFMNTVEFITE